MEGCANNVADLYDSIDCDVYIIGSGATMDYISMDFFNDKFVIGLNNMYKFFPCDYIVTHHHEIVQEAIDSGQRVICAKHQIAHPANAVHDFNGNYWFYEHTPQGFCKLDMTDFGKVIVAAGTPVVAALQIAWKFGATNIILCGVDGGVLDGRMNYSEYTIATQDGHPGRVRGVIEIVVNEIRKDIGVYSINPFINLTLEGHEFA